MLGDSLGLVVGEALGNELGVIETEGFHVGSELGCSLGRAKGLLRVGEWLDLIENTVGSADGGDVEFCESVADDGMPRASDVLMLGTADGDPDGVSENRTEGRETNIGALVEWGDGVKRGALAGAVIPVTVDDTLVVGTALFVGGAGLVSVGVRSNVGFLVGSGVGSGVGSDVGSGVGSGVGIRVGFGLDWVGLSDVGLGVDRVGLSDVGFGVDWVGFGVGFGVDCVGFGVGFGVDFVGFGVGMDVDWVGYVEGASDGRNDGAAEGSEEGSGASWTPIE
jgi:hypothetical protein